MAELKGFYFSLDALTASMVLIAAVGMLATYTPQTAEPKKPFQLDYLETAAMQNLTYWNMSKEYRNTVLTNIYTQYYSGNTSKAQNVCSSYFNFSRNYALYFSNSTQRDKVCGSLENSKEQELAANQVLVPDEKINGSFQNPKIATMVINY